MGGKFAGVGLTNALVLALLTILVIVALKVATAKYPITGLTDIIQAV